MVVTSVLMRRSTEGMRNSQEGTEPEVKPGCQLLPGASQERPPVSIPSAPAPPLPGVCPSAQVRPQASQPPAAPPDDAVRPATQLSPREMHTPFPRCGEGLQPRSPHWGPATLSLGDFMANRDYFLPGKKPPGSHVCPCALGCRSQAGPAPASAGPLPGRGPPPQPVGTLLLAGPQPQPNGLSAESKPRVLPVLLRSLRPGAPSGIFPDVGIAPGCSLLKTRKPAGRGVQGLESRRQGSGVQEGPEASGSSAADPGPTTCS